MIYIKNTANSQELQLPRTVEVADGAALTLCLDSTMQGQNYEIALTLLEESDRYLTVSFFGTAVAAGEYAYRLLAGEDVIARGVCKAVEAASDSRFAQFNDISVKYEQYGRNN